MDTGIRRPGALVAVLFAASASTPAVASAQLEVSAGITVVEDVGTQVGPTLTVTTDLARIRLPILLEFGVGRTDFAVLGQDYHNDHYSIAALARLPLVRGSTDLALGLGLGAYGEYQTVETNPPTEGGDNWAETAMAAITVSRVIAQETRVVLTLADAMLGPFDAIFDPSEFSVEHRFRILVGVHF